MEPKLDSIEQINWLFLTYPSESDTSAIILDCVFDDLIRRGAGLVYRVDDGCELLRYLEVFSHGNIAVVLTTLTFNLFLPSSKRYGFRESLEMPNQSMLIVLHPMIQPGLVIYDSTGNIHQICQPKPTDEASIAATTDSLVSLSSRFHPINREKRAA